MQSCKEIRNGLKLAMMIVAGVFILSAAAEDAKKTSSYTSPIPAQSFQDTMAKMKAAKPQIIKQHMDLLNQRYDLDNNPMKNAVMARGKAIQAGVRVKLPDGMTWDKLSHMNPETIKEKGVFPGGFMPLPFPNHPEDGMLFPQHVIGEIKKQEQRDLTRTKKMQSGTIGGSVNEFLRINTAVKIPIIFANIVGFHNNCLRAPMKTLLKKFDAPIGQFALTMDNSGCPCLVFFTRLNGN